MDKIKKIIKRIISEDLPNTNTSSKFEVGDVKSDRGVESTITDIDSETGRISWDINYLPDFEELFTNAADLVNTAKGVYTKAKTDDKLRLIYDEARVLRNKIRTHIRNEYPSEYKKITMNEDESLDEMSTTGGGNASFTPGTGMTYATPYAFRRSKKKHKPIPEGKSKEYRSSIISKASAKSSLKQIEKGKRDDGMGKFDAKVYAIDKDGKEQELKTLKDLDKYSSEFKYGLKENIDLKSYGYKLVPKNKAGNYVQKGSKLDVKQLFEDQKEFQSKRISAFDAIEQEMNDIYKMLSNAKNETSEYYNDNPSSYTVIKPTDLVLDYIKDIKNLLKGE